jgi:hypothetical protein
LGPEAKLRAQIYRRLKKLGIFYLPIVGHPAQTRGIPDLILIINGLFVGIELKAGKNKQSESQVEMEKKITKAGGKYYVVRSVAGLMEVLDDLSD